MSFLTLCSNLCPNLSQKLTVGAQHGGKLRCLQSLNEVGKNWEFGSKCDCQEVDNSEGKSLNYCKLAFLYCTVCRIRESTVEYYSESFNLQRYEA